MTTSLAAAAAKLVHPDGGKVASHQRMIHHMDEGIGQVMGALHRQGLLDDTLIDFTGDNGGERFSDNWPLVGGKMGLTEEGIRVPWLAHWPRQVPAGSVSHRHCMTMDWSTTLLEVGGGQTRPYFRPNGDSLLGVLKDPSTRFERPMLWRMRQRQQGATRWGRWKYLKADEHEYLFDITADARERANLAQRGAERLVTLRYAWLAWDASMPPNPAAATVSLGLSVKDMPQRQVSGDDLEPW